MKNNWEIKTLGDVCEIKSGSTPLRSNKLFWENGNFPWFTIDDIREQGRIITNTKQNVTELALSKLTIYPIDTILLCCTASVGEYAITKIPITSNQQFNGLTIKDSSLLIPEFLFYYSSTLKDLLLEKSGKTTIDFVSQAKVKEIPIPIPPIKEQEEIVEKLDKGFELIDSLKETAKKNLDNAKELFQSVLREELSPKEGWETKTFPQISENLDSKRIPITKNVRTDGNIPYYGASGIVDYVSDFIFDDKLLLVSEDGANLLARTYPIAFSIEGKTWVNNHAHVLKFNNLTTHKFVELYLNHINLEDFISGMAQPKLNQTMLNKIPIPFPPIKEQEEIVNSLDRIKGYCEELEGNYKRVLELCEELKQGLLREAFEVK